MDWTYSELMRLAGPGWRYDGDEDLLGEALAGVSIDSRRIRERELFVALRGERFDAHEFVDAAFAKGASAAVVERRWWGGLAQPRGNFIVVEDTLSALQQMSAVYRRRFAIPVLAITGSSGKTTTKELIATVLETRFRVLKTEGNLNNHIGLPLTLLRLDREHEIAVVEMGMNHPGEIAHLSEIAAPTHALVTNIGKGHLGFFKNIEELARAKMELFERVASEGTAFVNVDDPLICATKPRLAHVVRYSLSKQVDVVGDVVGLDENGFLTLQLRIGSESEIVHIPIPGRHNASNGLSAAAVGHHFGIPLSDIKRGIESCEPLAKRMEIVRKNGMVIINDCYNANPDSMRAALELLRDMKAPDGAERIAILGDMLELGAFEAREHRALGEELAAYGTDRLFAYGPASSEVVTAARAAGLKQSEHFSDKRALLRAAKKATSGPCVVLVKGSRAMAMEGIVDALLERGPRPENPSKRQAA